MATISQKVCDRCGKPFEYRLSKWAGYFKQGIKRENHLHFHNMLYGNPDGYSYIDERYELCADCTEKLLHFLRSGKNESVEKSQKS